MEPAMFLLPWLIIPLILYNVCAFLLTPDAMTVSEYLASEIFSLSMYSGGTWTFTIGDGLLFLTLLIMFVEIIKATRTGPVSMLDHSLSMIVFILCLVEFLIRPEAATSVFFLIMVAALIDVVAGFMITISSARRDMAVG